MQKLTNENNIRICKVRFVNTIIYVQFINGTFQIHVHVHVVVVVLKLSGPENHARS
jgi:hypothetical protein